MFPDFARIGDDEVKKKELFYDWAQDQQNYNEETFGYVPRFQWLRTHPDTVTGTLREKAVGTQYGKDNFHLGRRFESALGPVLSDNFLQCTPRSDEIFALPVSNDDHLYYYIYHDIIVDRKMPKFSIPGI